MRVVTAVGLGNARDWPESPNRAVIVDLDPPSQKGKVVELRKREIARKFISSGVFPLTDFALVQIIDITCLGVISHLKFYQSLADAKSAFNESKPNNEVRLLLNLKSLTFQIEQGGWFGEENYIWLQPWIDRWGRERSSYPSLSRELPTLEKFDSWRRDTQGTSGNILASVFLELDRKKILRFCISVTSPYGVVYERIRKY